jgi:hypothetical protein
MARITLYLSFILLLGPAPAEAMSIRTSVSLLAWSSNGNNALLQEDRDGPEGGGALAYLIVSTRPVGVVRAVVSSDFSPGGGSTPQVIGVQACKEALARLAAGIKRAKFAGISVRPGGCEKKRRHGMIKVAHDVSAGSVRTMIGQGKRVIVDGKTELWIHKGKVLIGSPPRKVHAGEAPETLAVYRASKGHPLLVLRKNEQGGTRLEGLYRPDKKAPARFKKVKLPSGKGL